MLKWCPKQLAQDRGRNMDAPEPGAAFAPDQPPGARPSREGTSGDRGFEKDAGLTGSRSLWDLLGRAEKEALLERARQSLAEEFEAREKDWREGQRQELDRIREEFETRFENWTRELSAGAARDRQERAVEAAALAVALAGKIIRDTVRVDDGMVVRTLETALYKAQDAHPLTVYLHPDDAEYVAGRPSLMQRLRIEKVVPDRRLEKGGCRVRAGSREWDATITRQLESLTAIVEETLAEGEADLLTGPGDTHDPGLE